MKKDIFEALFDIIGERKKSSADKSYTASLMAGGTQKINDKITEEAGEVCSAALEDDIPHLIHEICDLFFHTSVLAVYRGISLDDIKKELERRFGISGLEEKAGRKK